MRTFTTSTHWLIWSIRMARQTQEESQYNTRTDAMTENDALAVENDFGTLILRCHCGTQQRPTMEMNELPLLCCIRTSCPLLSPVTYWIPTDEPQLNLKWTHSHANVEYMASFPLFHAPELPGALDGFGRGVCGDGHGHFGDFHSGLDAALGRSVGVDLQAAVLAV